MVRACSSASPPRVLKAWWQCTSVMRSRKQIKRSSRNAPTHVGSVLCAWMGRRYR
jgi:hypothetical protein